MNLTLDFHLCTRDSAEYVWFMLVNLVSSRLTEQGIINAVSGNCISLIQGFESQFRIDHA